MADRLKKIGIKQVVRLEWMEHTLQMLLADLKPKEIQLELLDYLENRKQSGGLGDRGIKTFPMAINILMQSWVKPHPDIISLRDACLEYASNNLSSNKLIHWVMISTAYPFWFQTSNVIGRLFGLQEIISKQQIIKRLKEIYGDRQTVARNARYVIRSFVAWGMIKDTDKRGYYCAEDVFNVEKEYLISLLCECNLLNTPDRKLPFSSMINSPAFYHFPHPHTAPGIIDNQNPRIMITLNGIDDSIFSLNSLKLID
jgi:hypothetical protein